MEIRNTSYQNHQSFGMRFSRSDLRMLIYEAKEQEKLPELASMLGFIDKQKGKGIKLGACFEGKKDYVPNLFFIRVNRNNNPINQCNKNSFINALEELCFGTTAPFSVSILDKHMGKRVFKFKNLLNHFKGPKTIERKYALKD